MDYALLIKGLKEEAKRNVQFARMKKFPRFLARVLTLPWLLAAMFAFLCYYVTLFAYKACSTPIHYLHNIIKDEKNGNQGVQVVVYIFGFPVIFLLYAVMSLAAVSFYFQWFNIMVIMVFATLNGIKFQPFITDASYDYERVWELKPTDKKANFWVPSIIIRLIIAVVAFVIGMFFSASGEVRLGGAEMFIGGIFLIAAVVVVVTAVFSALFAPLYLFKKTEILDFEDFEISE